MKNVQKFKEKLSLSVCLCNIQVFSGLLLKCVQCEASSLDRWRAARSVLRPCLFFSVCLASFTLRNPTWSSIHSPRVHKHALTHSNQLSLSLVKACCCRIHSICLSLTHPSIGLFLGHHPQSQQSLNVIKNVSSDAKAHLLALLICSFYHIFNLAHEQSFSAKASVPCELKECQNKKFHSGNSSCIETLGGRLQRYHAQSEQWARRHGRVT